MVLPVLFVQGCIVKPGVARDGHTADGFVEAGIAAADDAVHGVVGGDKEAHLCVGTVLRHWNKMAVVAHV